MSAFKRTVNLVFMRDVMESLAGLIDDAVGAAGPLDGAEVVFYAAGPSPDPGRAMADYTVAAISAAPTTLALGATVMNLPNGAIGRTQNVQHTAGPAPAAESILGYLVYTPGAPDVLLAAEEFAQPVPIALEGDFVSLDLVVAEPPSRATGLT